MREGNLIKESSLQEHVTLRCSVTPARGPQRERKKHACGGKDGRQEVAGIERAAPVGEDTGDDRADHLPGADEDGENTEAVCGLSGPRIVSDSGPHNAGNAPSGEAEKDHRQVEEGRGQGGAHQGVRTHNWRRRGRRLGRAGCAGTSVR